MNYTDLLLDGMGRFESQPLTDDLLHQVKRCILDWVGVASAGGRVIERKVAPLQAIASKGPCSVFTSANRFDLSTASLINSMAAHEIELDDGNRFGMIHVGSVIITAMIAVAQHECLSSQQFFKGVISGYQVAIRLAKQVQPYLKRKGIHATGSCGSVAVAYAVAKALGLDRNQTKNAISAASVRAGGLMQWLDSSSEFKDYSAGGAVNNGVISAFLAKGGFQGAIDPLGDKRGFVSVFSPEAALNCDLWDNDSPEILNVYFKPYVSCRHCHAPAEAVLLLKTKYGIRWQDVTGIRVETYRLAIGGHDNKEIDSVGAAKMSIPYCVAVSLFSGSCGLDSFSEGMISNNDVKAITHLVNVVEDEGLTILSPRKRGAIVSITTRTIRVSNMLEITKHWVI